MKKFVPIISLCIFLIAKKSEAVCAICTLSICLGVGLSRWLGIDDVISGLWIGGLIISIIIVALKWLNMKKIKFKLKELTVSIFIYSLIIYLLYIQGMIGIQSNTLFCVDKLLLGIFFGSVALLAGIWSNAIIKKRNNSKAYFPFQKVVIPIAFLSILSGVFYFIVR